jgi:hypothetical protein
MIVVVIVLILHIHGRDKPTPRFVFFVNERNSRNNGHGKRGLPLPLPVQYNIFSTEYGLQIRQCSKEPRTAQWGSESLIHRYDLKLKAIAEFKEEVIVAQERLTELLDGNEGVL